MKIYRVELENGEGPYQARLVMSGPWEDLPPCLFPTKESHPHPAFDGFPPDGMEPWEYLIPREMSFGFTSRESLEAWFFIEPGDSQKMENLGLFVRTYEVDAEHVEEGNSQAMFRKDLAERVDPHTPTEYAGINDEREEKQWQSDTPGLM